MHKVNEPIAAKDARHLRELINAEMAQFGAACDLNHIDVSGITEFDGVFRDCLFNGDISRWDMSNARSAVSMFLRCPFNGDISNWNVEKLEDASHMFSEGPFNGDLSKWDVSSIITMYAMFSNGDFNGDISGWDIASLQDMSHMFRDNCVFNKSLASWDVAGVKHMTGMFVGAHAAPDVGSWNISPSIDAYDVFLATPAALHRQTPSYWNVGAFIWAKQLPADEAWKKAFAVVAPIAHALGLNHMEHAQAIVAEYAMRMAPPEAIALPVNFG